MCSVTEKPTADDLQPQPGQTARVTPAMLAGRRRKETLLPEITQMALEGHSSQAIADKLGMPKRTVNYWLQEARQEWIARAALSAAEMFAADLARLDAIYREAMQAWRNSQSEIEVRLVQHTQPADGKATSKRSIRSQPQRGNAAFLTRATAAVMASWRLKGKPGPPSIDAIAARTANRSRWRHPSRGCGERGFGKHERRSAPRLPCSAVCHHRGHRRTGRIPCARRRRRFAVRPRELAARP